jgi:hypothetical protein
MTIETIVQELSASERQVLIRDQGRWRSMRNGGHLNDWLSFGPGLLIRRHLAMRLAHTNKPKGSKYKEYFLQLLEHDGLHTMDSQSRSAVLWLHEDAERLTILNDEICATMTPGEHARFNSPITAMQRVKKRIEIRDRVRAGQPAEQQQPRRTRVAELQQEVAEKTRTIAHLEERLAAAEVDDGGSLFDFHADSSADIANVMVNTNRHKAREIYDALGAALHVRARAH